MTDKTSSCFVTVLPTLPGAPLVLRPPPAPPVRPASPPVSSTGSPPSGVFRLLLGPQLPGVSHTGSSGLGSSSDFCWVPLPAWTAALGSRLTPPRLLILGSRLAALGPRSRLVAYSTPALGSWVLGSRLQVLRVFQAFLACCRNSLR